jgi:hypothetical protein
MLWGVLAMLATTQGLLGSVAPPTDPPAELPSWLRVHGDDTYLKGVLQELFANEAFASQLQGAFAPEEGQAFNTVVGGRPYLDELNRAWGPNRQVKLDRNVGGVSIYADQPDGSVNMGGVVIDLDRIHKTVRQDSAQAREIVRDALLHEFAHLLPVAQSRNIGDRTGDPNPKDRDAAQHPVIQGENRLRGLFNLPAKTFYGLMERR